MAKEIPIAVISKVSMTGNTFEDIGNKAGEIYQRIYLKVREAKKEEA